MLCRMIKQERKYSSQIRLLYTYLLVVVLAACQNGTQTGESTQTTESTRSLETTGISGSTTPDAKFPTETEVASNRETKQNLNSGNTESAYPYPASESGPISTPNKPQVVSTPVIGQSTPPLDPNLGSTFDGTYPLPQDPLPFEPGGDTPNPYPGSEELGFQPQLGTEADTDLPEGTPSQGTPSPQIVIPTSGIVRTEILATDPGEFTLSSGEIQLVEFYALWAPISLSMAPVMNSLEDQFKNQVRFVYLDLEDPSNALYKHLLSDRLPPVFFLLDRNGQILHEWQGLVQREDFESILISQPGG